MQAERPLVSVVTPSYNQAQYLEDTMRSILDQSYENIEYLVLDGGSSDGSVGIIKQYAHRLAYWVSEPDGGQAEAINRGWRRAKGDILAYLNADDLYCPGAIASAVNCFQRHPDVSIVYGCCYSLLPDGSRYLYCPQEFSLEALVMDNFIPQPAVFLRRSVLEAVGFLDPSLQHGMDYDLWLRAALRGMSFQRLAAPALASFRIWPGSKTSNDPEGRMAERRLLLDRVYAHNAAPPSLSSVRGYALAKAYLSVAYGVSLSGETGSGWHYLGQAVRHAPSIMWNPQFLRLTLAMLLGQWGSRFARRATWAVLRQFGGR